MKSVGKVVSFGICGIALLSIASYQLRLWLRWRNEQRFYLGLRDSLLRFQHNTVGEHE